MLVDSPNFTFALVISFPLPVCVPFRIFFFLMCLPEGILILVPLLFLQLWQQPPLSHLFDTFFLRNTLSRLNRKTQKLQPRENVSFVVPFRYLFATCLLTFCYLFATWAIPPFIVPPLTFFLK